MIMIKKLKFILVIKTILRKYWIFLSLVRLTGIFIVGVVQRDVTEFINQGLVAKGYTNVWDVGTGDIIASNPFFSVVWAQPILFHLKLQLDILSVY